MFKKVISFSIVLFCLCIISSNALAQEESQFYQYDYTPTMAAVYEWASDYPVEPAGDEPVELEDTSFVPISMTGIGTAVEPASVA